MRKGFDTMKKLDKLKRIEQETATVMMALQKEMIELTGIDPNGGQLGISEIYKIAYQAALDAMKESKSLIYTGPTQ